MKERDILFDVLFDFLKELPEWFDRNATTYDQVEKLIEDFMKRHGLDESQNPERL